MGLTRQVTSHLPLSISYISLLAGCGLWSVRLSDLEDQAVYSHPARAKHCALLGFLWLRNSELLYIRSAYYIVTSSQAETDTIPVWSVRGGNIVKVSNLALHLISVYLSAYISVKVDHQIKLFIINNDGVSLTQVQAATP